MIGLTYYSQSTSALAPGGCSATATTVFYLHKFPCNSTITDTARQARERHSTTPRTVPVHRAGKPQGAGHRHPRARRARGAGWSVEAQMRLEREDFCRGRVDARAVERPTFCGLEQQGVRLTAHGFIVGVQDHVETCVYGYESWRSPA